MSHFAPITVAPPVWQRALVWLGLPAAGAGLGWLVHLVAGWVASLPSIPFQGPFKIVAALPRPYGLIGVLAVGVAAGLVLAFLAHLDELAVTVDAAGVRLARGDIVDDFDRGSVAAAFSDKSELVLLRSDGKELAREKHDLKPGRLAGAFGAFGIRWLDHDPYEETYRRWVDGTPGLSTAANALLKARAEALKNGDQDDLRELRRELARLNVVVRDRNKKQFWR
ncbi:YqeB family protein [Fodinicola acaciae]|uniref:YqeB family protein n=1 Tax=Fodinicola acaciae TaxID=2681555 RepID=UPI0013D03696|nr:hypothetical protein [Fodinicola acaciae]